MIIATLASCDRSFSKSVRMSLFSMSTSALSSLKKNLEKSSQINGKSWQINEITYLNELIFFRYTLFIGYFFSFQHKLHQSTNMYNYHGNGSRVGCSDCSDLDESFGYYDIKDVKVESVFSNGESNSTGRK